MNSTPKDWIEIAVSASFFQPSVSTERPNAEKCFGHQGLELRVAAFAIRKVADTAFEQGKCDMRKRRYQDSRNRNFCQLGRTNGKKIGPISTVLQRLFSAVELQPKSNFKFLESSSAQKQWPWKALLFLFSIGLASGCSSPEFRGLTAKFGEAVQASASNQTDRLGKLTAVQIDDIRGGLAVDRLHLSYSPGCAELLIQGASQQNCKVVRTDGKPISQAQTFASVLALNKAMGDYGKNLALLAEDSSEDAAAFNKSLLDLIVSFEGLGAALRSTGSTDATDPTGLNVFSTGLTKVSGLFFAASRARKLREIIIAADPKVQAAAKILSQASEGLATFEVTHAIEQADRTQVSLRRSLASGARTAKIAELQSKLFADVAQIKQLARLKDTYAVIGKSHGELTKAARAGSSKDDLSAAIVELLQVASALKELDT